jgi:acetylornithine deacetylase
LVSLIASFLYFSKVELPFNLLLAISAEEEISGKHGMEYLIKMLPEIEMAIVGEPTQMNVAYAERGLMVVDALAKGKAGHAARKEGINAIGIAIKDIDWINSYAFDVDDLLKPSMTVTMINAGSQHNVIPDSCEFVIDVRSADKYTNEAIFDLLNNNLKSELKARSFRLKSSYLPTDHLLRKTAKQLSLHQYASPTLSDQALMDFPSIKMGPGNSERSHQANEFIYLEEIKTGIDKYIEFIEQLKSNYEEAMDKRYSIR